MSKISINQKIELITEEWTLKIIAESNGQLVWHQHENEDELFIVFKGYLTIQLRDENIELDASDMFVVPKGVEHCPRAELDTHFMMIEPSSTAHTGELESDVTVI